MDRYDAQIAERATDARLAQARATDRVAKEQGREADAQIRQAAAMERIADALERLLTPPAPAEAESSTEQEAANV